MTPPKSGLRNSVGMTVGLVPIVGHAIHPGCKPETDAYCRIAVTTAYASGYEVYETWIENWAVALYMMTTGLKGVSSMKVYRELGITQKTAWFMMQRIREGFMGESGVMADPVEAAGRQNIREFGTMDQMRFLAQGLVGKRLRYKDLTA